MSLLKSESMESIFCQAGDCRFRALVLAALTEPTWHL